MLWLPNFKELQRILRGSQGLFIKQIESQHQKGNDKKKITPILSQTNCNFSNLVVLEERDFWYILVSNNLIRKISCAIVGFIYIYEILKNPANLYMAINLRLGRNRPRA